MAWGSPPATRVSAWIDCRPMRIAVLTNNYPPHSLGGYELLCAEHVAWLRQRGHAVVVLASTYGLAPRYGPGRERTETGAAGETVVRALDFHWHDFEHDRPTGLRLWEGERRQRLALDRVLREHGVQGAFLWHQAGLSKSLIAELGRRGLPMVAVVGEPWPAWDIAADHWLQLWDRDAVRPLARLAKPPLRRLADRLVAPVSLDGALAALVPAYASEHLRRIVDRDAPPQWPRGGAVVPNGIRLDQFVRSRTSREDGETLRCLYAGRIERRKGVHVAVDAVAAATRRGVPATLTVRGWADAAYLAELRQQATAAGLDVDWQEAAPREQMPDVYAAHDVLLFPTLWDEPFGLVPVEAMAGGCVVVATGSGGSGEYLEDGANCLVAPPGDAEAVAAHLQRLSGDPRLVDALRAGGLRTAREHDFEGYARRLEALLAGAVAPAQ